MFADHGTSWNLRDRHMAETLAQLRAHLERHGERARIVVWEHNSHVGDARVTEMGRRGELNVGQLARERWPGDAVLVGFTTYAGTVTAASAWDAPAERKRVRPALPGSYEALFHEAGEARFLLDLARGEAAEPLRGPLLERAIGVIYRPRDRAGQPLLPGQPRRPVRRADPHRRDPRGRAARARRRLGARRAAGDLPVGAVRGGEDG